MANWNDPNMAASGFPGTARGMDQAVDAGLRSYMLSVYNYMGSGVLLTGIVAMLAYNSGFTASMIGSPLMWVVMLAPLAFVLVLSFGINKLSTTAAQMLFWAYAAVMGLSMSTIFLAFTQTSIAQTFFATAAAFLPIGGSLAIGLPLEDVEFWAEKLARVTAEQATRAARAVLKDNPVATAGWLLPAGA